MAPKSNLIDSSIDHSYRIINGSFQISQCTINEKLKINGAATIGQNTIIKKTIIVNGQLEITGAALEGNLLANGTTSINSSILRRKSHFSGNLTVRDCQFSDSIILLAQNASFVNCQINHMIIQALPYIKISQKILLSNGCKVSGDITFESKNGEVWIEKSSQIDGEINGGKIIFI